MLLGMLPVPNEKNVILIVVIVICTNDPITVLVRIGCFFTQLLVIVLGF
jgi:hypothetical protein